MTRSAGRWLAYSLLVLGALMGTLGCADARSGARAPTDQSLSPVPQSEPAPTEKPAGKPAALQPPAAQPPDNHASSAKPPTADDICRALEQDAAENELPVEFFARVIWQESRFNAQAVSSKGAQGIAQFMPQTASFRGPCRSVRSDRGAAQFGKLSAAICSNKFGNLGLAAAGYNAGPGRVSAWLAGHRALPEETRNYVAIITGWTADEWASPSPPKTRRDHDPAGRALHAACQSDPGAEGRSAAHRRLCAALGHAAHRQLVGEQGLGRSIA